MFQTVYQHHTNISICFDKYEILVLSCSDILLQFASVCVSSPDIDEVCPRYPGYCIWCESDAEGFGDGSQTLPLKTTLDFISDTVDRH